MVYFFLCFHCTVVSIHLQCQKKKSWEKLGSCVSVKVFICMITLRLEKRKCFLGKSGDSLG